MSPAPLPTAETKQVRDRAVASDGLAEVVSLVPVLERVRNFVAAVQCQSAVLQRRGGAFAVFSNASI